MAASGMAARIAANRKRDRRVTTELENSGWTVIRIPEHDLRTKAALAKTVVAIAEFIRATTSKKTRVA